MLQRYCSFALALSCIHILSWRGIRRALPQTILPPSAAAALTGCFSRLVYFDFWLFNLLIACACLSQNYFAASTLHPCSRYRSFTLALSCIHILSSRGIRRSPSRTILPPSAAAALTGCFLRLVCSDFRSFTPLTASACFLPELFCSVSTRPLWLRAEGTHCTKLSPGKTIRLCSTLHKTIVPENYMISPFIIPSYAALRAKTFFVRLSN